MAAFGLVLLSLNVKLRLKDHRVLALRNTKSRLKIWTQLRCGDHRGWVVPMGAGPYITYLIRRVVSFYNIWLPVYKLAHHVF